MRNRREQGRVLLVSMPLSALHYPSIGISLLKPALESVGVICDVRYCNLEFADRIGAETHDLVTAPDLYQALPGDWVFAPFAEADPGDTLAGDLAYFDTVLLRHFPQFHTPANLFGLLAARREAGVFLDDLARTIDVSAYDLVGFTSSFQQNTASLGLAHRLKARRPDLPIVFGGANCRAELGLELLRRYDFIDAVCTGEGDRSFPRFVEALIRIGRVPSGIAGMATRAAAADDGDIVDDLDALPTPDFDSFFAQHAASPVARESSRPAGLFETSRGCWWGAKHHCTFCGINGKSMAYRRKSPDRALAEIDDLIGRYGPDLVNVDAILDTRYFETLLPKLAALETPMTAYYELKANLRPDQFTKLADAGILKIQPGIESLDSEILDAMKKGCTAIQNVQTLKLAAEHSLFVEWNFLTGFPGERTEHYERMAALIPHLTHLQPPNAIGRVRADRFSPYQQRPESFGVTIAPNPAYRFIYAGTEEDVAAMAYHFDIQGGTDADPDAVRVTERLCREWRGRGGRDACSYECHDDGTATLRVRRGSSACTQRLDERDAAILDAAWTITTVRRIGTDRVDTLVAAGLMMREGDQVLALPYRLRQSGTAPSWEQVRRESVVRRSARRREAPAQVDMAE